MKLHFVKVNPVQNMTIFIMDPLPRSKHFSISNKLMDYDNLNAEQVGFIETTNNGNLNDSYIRLQMMGGEFCGNATRSLAALMVHNSYPEGIEQIDDNTYNVNLYTSGLNNELITCTVKNTEEEHAYFSKVNMPLPKKIEDVNFSLDSNGEKNINTIRVDFPGMTHFIVDDTDVVNRDDFYELIKTYMEQEDYDAFGIMYYNYDTKFLIPLVYVRATDSLFWEKSCGSGTSALGAALAHKYKKDIKENIEQPGGYLEVDVRYDNKVTKLSLNGLVKIVAEGIVNI